MRHRYRVKFRHNKLQGLLNHSRFNVCYLLGFIDRNYRLKMNCIKFDSKNKKTVLTRVKIPIRVDDTEVVVKVAFAGICGTDLHIVEGHFTAKDNITIGHELCGIVTDISPRYDHLKIGDRVSVNPNKSCGICIPCKKNQTNFCKEGGLQNALGIMGLDGGWAEYCKIHVSQVTRIPDKVSFDQALLCEPISCIIHGLDKLHDLEIGANILIVGAGIIGLLWSCILHTIGHRRVIVSEPNVERQKTLLQLGLGYKCTSWNEIVEYKKQNPEYMVDLCIDCSGRTDAMQAALPYVQNGGTFLIFGVASPEQTLIVNPYKLFYNEITVLGVNINTPNSFERAMAYIESMSERYLIIEKLGIGKFPLKKHEEALKAFKTGSFTKLMFKPAPDDE